MLSFVRQIPAYFADFFARHEAPVVAEKTHIFQAPKPLILSGFSSQPLATEIADILRTRVVKVGRRQFDDKEIYTEIEDNVRGHEVVVVASASGDPNKQIIETAMLASAAKKTASKVTLLIPYHWYGRGDGKWSKRTSPTLDIIVGILQPHADQFILVDPHNPVHTQAIYEGNPATKNSEIVHFAYPWAVQIKALVDQGMINRDNILFMHADGGGPKRIGPDIRECFYRVLGIEGRNPSQDDWPQGIKHRDSTTGKITIDDISDNVAGRDVVVLEDLLASGGTSCNLATLLKGKGARSVSMFVTNTIASTDPIKENILTAVRRVNASALDFVGTMDTYNHTLTDPQIQEAMDRSPVIHVMPAAQHLASIIDAMHMKVGPETGPDDNSVSAFLRGKHALQASGQRYAFRPIAVKAESPLRALSAA